MKLKITFLILSMIGFGVYLYFNFFWIEVQYQRVTGPEFLVKEDKSKLVQKFGKHQNANYTMVFTDVKTEDENGFLKFENYYLNGTFDGLRAEFSRSNTKFLALKDSSIVPKFIVQAVLILALIFLAIFLWLLRSKLPDPV